MAIKHQVTLAGQPILARPVLPAMPQVAWEKNRIRIWDATHFTRSKRVAYAIIDVVTRYWIGFLLSSEQTSTQAQLLFAHALDGSAASVVEYSLRTGAGRRLSGAAREL